MRVATCKNCDHKWNWKTSVKKLLTLRNVMKCPHCGEEQYMSAKSQKRLSIYLFTPLILWLILSVLNFPLQSVMTVTVLGLVVSIMMMPFSYELSDEEEPLW